MRRRALVLAAVAAAAPGGCGGGDDQEPVRAPAAVEREVRAVFAGYTEAMRARDYARACSYLSPESITRVIDEAAGLSPAPTTCPAALEGRIAGGSAEGRRELDQVAATAKVDGVYEIAGRDDAVTIAWAATVGGKRVPVQQPARTVAGEWKLVSGPPGDG